MREWRSLGVERFFAGRRPWLGYHERALPTLAALAGAQPQEVTVMNSLTVNLHLLMASFYQPAAGRTALLLERALGNLTANAIKFTDAGGTVTLAVEARDGDVALSVRDTGIGMSAEQLKSLFVRFHQAEASTNRMYGGSGLGLHLSRELCQLLGGQITVASTPGVGTTVIVDLPRQAPALPHR